MILFDNFTLHHGSKTLLKNHKGSFLKGKFVGITGPNGSGKTSLLRALTGLDKNYEGHLFLYEKNMRFYSLQDLAHHRTYIPATHMCYWSLSTCQVLEIENPFFRDSHPLLKNLDIAPLLHQEFATLSSGEKARVFLAYALIKNKNLLILDEITSHLDDVYQEHVFHLLKEAAYDGQLIILATHHKDLAFRYCDQVLSLEDQQLVSLKRARPTLVEVQ